MRALLAIVVFSLAAPVSAMACGMRMTKDTEVLLVDALNAIDAPAEVVAPVDADVAEAVEVVVDPTVVAVQDPAVEPAAEPQAVTKPADSKKPQS
ncbi:MAG: hypothetical protein AB8H79_15935 [Myxococcota bacterium]